MNSTFFKNKTAVQADSAEGGVHVNSAILKNTGRVQADSAFLDITVRSSHKLRIF